MRPRTTQKGSVSAKSMISSVRAEPVVLGLDVGWEENLGQRECEQDAGRIRSGERAPHEPSATTLAAASLLDQRACAVVDEVEQTFGSGLLRDREWLRRRERLLDAHTVSSSRDNSARPLLETVSGRPFCPSRSRA